MINNNLLAILACPVCKGKLIYKKTLNELICKPCRLSYPIVNDIPVMLEDNAKKLSLEEIDKIKG